MNDNENYWWEYAGSLLGISFVLTLLFQGCQSLLDFVSEKTSANDSKPNNTFSEEYDGMTEEAEQFLGQFEYASEEINENVSTLGNDVSPHSYDNSKNVSSQGEFNEMDFGNLGDLFVLDFKKMVQDGKFTVFNFNNELFVGADASNYFSSNDVDYLDLNSFLSHYILENISSDVDSKNAGSRQIEYSFISVDEKASDVEFVNSTNEYFNNQNKAVVQILSNGELYFSLVDVACNKMMVLMKFDSVEDLQTYLIPINLYPYYTELESYVYEIFSQQQADSILGGVVDTKMYVRELEIK